MKNCSSLYIHIPFCRSKCSYCDFFSLPTPNKDAVSAPYVLALKKELEYRCKMFNPDFWRTVYIGGGTPSLLSAAQLEEILSFVRESVPGGMAEDCEVTIETNPADVTPDFLETIARLGVNRLSVGIQCVSQRVLEFLGRRSDAATVEYALDCIKSLWKKEEGRRFSADLIAGLPFLTDDEYLEGIEKILDSGADHVSLYSLMLEEGTLLWKQVQEGNAPYSDDDIERQWFLGRDRLEKAGIMQYEVSNFARPSFESRHNTVYWHMDDFIGIGAGASGTVGNLRWTGVRSVPEYVSGWLADGVPQEKELLDSKTQEYEFLMMGFRLRSGISSAEYRKRFGRELSERIGAEKGLFADWEKNGLALRREKDGDTFFALTGDGLMLLNRFLTEL